MGKYVGYEKYKDSGVEWLGDIPEHWRRSIFRYYFDIQLGKMLQNEPRTEHDEEISYLKAIHVRWDKVDTYDLPKMWASPREKDKYYVKNGDLLISEGGEVGRTTLLKDLQEDCIIQNALHRVRSLSESSVEYLNYLMRHISDTEWLDILCNKSTIAHLTSEKVAALALPVPPLDEQESIAHFLDHKTSQIDALIAKKESLLEKLDEKRTALISHAVTKGLDPNVPMKDYGVEWLGDIPEHWQIIRLKHLSEKITDGEHISPKNIDNGIPLLSAKDIRERYIKFDNASYVSEQDARKFWNRCKPERGNILIVSRGATVGRIGFVETNQKFCLMGSVILIKLKDTICPDFIYFASNQDYVQKNIIQVSDASAQQAIYLIDVKETNFLLPSGEEQEKIAEFLNRKTAEIDRQKAKVKEAITLLKEYRTALITNAVTGKIDVRQGSRV
jgi:type I restriction enzyme S subunit